MSGAIYRLLADLLLALHVAFVLFVVVGLVVVITGGLLGWSWVRDVRIRLVHLGAIVIVAVQAWLGRICPLTTLEMWLRQRAGEATYRGSFIAHWLDRLLYYDAPAWVFVVAYTAFALAVAGAWWAVPPHRVRRRQPPESS